MLSSIKYVAISIFYNVSFCQLFQHIIGVDLSCRGYRTPLRWGPGVYRSLLTMQIQHGSVTLTDLHIDDKWMGQGYLFIFQPRTLRSVLLMVILEGQYGSADEFIDACVPDDYLDLPKASVYVLLGLSSYPWELPHIGLIMIRWLGSAQHLYCFRWWSR